MFNDKYSENIATSIKDYLDEDEWHYSFDEKAGRFRYTLTTKDKLKTISYTVNVHKDDYVVYAVSPLGADAEDEDMLTRMSEFINRANYGLLNGSFEFDFRDGEIRYKTFVNCDGSIPSIDVVRGSILTPAAMFKRYGNGIVKIIFTDITAKEAVEECESTTSKEFRSMLSHLCDLLEDEDTVDKLKEIIDADDEGQVMKLLESFKDEDSDDDSDDDIIDVEEESDTDASIYS